MISTMQRLADLRPGDIMLGPIGGLTGLGVGLGQLVLGEAFRQGTLSVRHAGVVVKGAEWSGGDPERGIPVAPPLLAQAMPTGAEIIGMEPEHWTERHAYVRLPEDYAGQALDAAAVAERMVREGVAYSFASYPSLAAWKLTGQSRLAKWINRRRPPVAIPWPSGKVEPVTVALPVEAICSVFADQAWSLTGKRIVEDTRPQAVTPGMLADTLTCLEGATWCRPRPHIPGARVWTV